ncbi:MAG: tetratricopeptide repeat protein [Candidatus Omnitrophica bacterium]|nr:tetratricopeptide repeat protein [Candidatus Omnitrophota bacterium]
MRKILIAIFIAVVFTSIYAEEDISWQVEEYLDGYNDAYIYGDYQKAIDLGTSALGVIEKKFGPDHPNDAAMINNLATLYKIKGNYAQADELYQKALGIYELTLGLDNLYTAKVWNALGENYQAWRKFNEAESSYNNSIDILEKNLGSNDPAVAIVRSHLGSLYLDQHKYAEAESILKTSLQAIADSGQEYPKLIRLASDMGKLYEKQQKFTEAEQYYRYAWGVFKSCFYQEDASIDKAINRLKSEAAKLWSQINEPIYKRLMDINDLYIGPWHPDAPRVLDNLPMLYLKETRYAEAVNIYEDSLEIMMSNLGQEHLNVAKVLENMAKFYRKMNKPDKAKEASEKAEFIRSKKRY